MTEEERTRLWVRRRVINPLASVLYLLSEGQADGECIRASGDCVCELCGVPYSRHAKDPLRSFLVVACDGRRLKL